MLFFVDLSFHHRTSDLIKFSPLAKLLPRSEKFVLAVLLLFVCNLIVKSDRKMDAFGDGKFDQPEVDPAAEFLAREQNALAGLEDEIPPVTTGNGFAEGDDVTQPKADSGAGTGVFVSVTI